MLTQQEDFDIYQQGTAVLYMLSSPNGQYVALKRTSDLMLYSINMAYEIIDVMQQKVIAEIKAFPYRRNYQQSFSTDSRYFWHQTRDNIIEIIDLQNLNVTEYDIGIFHSIEIHPPNIFILDQQNIFNTQLGLQKIIDCFSYQNYVSNIKIYTQNLWLLESTNKTNFLDYKRSKVLATWKHKENSYFFQNSENKIIFIRGSNHTYYCYNLQNKKLVRKVRIKLYHEIFFLQTQMKLFTTMAKNHQKMPIGIRIYDLLQGREEFEASDINLEGLSKDQISNRVLIKIINKFRAYFNQK